MELVDILLPPTFKKSGTTKSLKQAWTDEDWVGTFNLWIVQNNPQPAIIYQQRSPKSNWAPLKLDVSSGGHYQAGETIKDGLREVKEELGKNYDFNKLLPLGRKIHVSPDTEGNERHNLVDIFMIIDNSPLNTYQQQQSEVYSLVICPLADLIKVHTSNYSFIAYGLDNQGKNLKIKVSCESFPYNWDNYHFKIALLADRYLKNEKNLIY